MNKKENKTWIKWTVIITVIIGITVAVLLYFNKQFTVSFISDGGSTIPQQQVKRGEKIEEPQAPSRDGYRFICWTYNGSSFSFSRKVDRNMVLIAKWEKIIKANQIFLDKEEYFVNVNESITFKPSFLPEDANEDLDGYVDDETIATIDPLRRTLTGLKEGSTTFTISCESTFISCKVTVLPIAESIDIGEKEKEMSIGDTYQISPKIYPENAYGEMIYSSSNNSIVTVSQDGLVTAIEEGEAVITVKCGKKIKEELAIRVKFNGEEKITVSPNRITLDVTANPSEKLQAIYSCSSKTDKTLYYTTSDPTVATVDENGVVKAVGRGNCEIQVTSKNGHSGWAYVYVAFTANNITASPSTISVEKGKTLDIKGMLSFEPAAAKASYSYVYTISDNDNVSINGEGIISGLKASPNSARVTVYCKSLTETVPVEIEVYCDGEELLVNTNNFNYVSYSKPISMTDNTIQLRKYTKGQINTTDLTTNINCTIQSYDNALTKDGRKIKSNGTVNEECDLQCTFKYNDYVSDRFTIHYIPKLDLWVSCQQDHTLTRIDESTYELTLDENNGRFTLDSTNMVTFQNPSAEEGLSIFSIDSVFEIVDYNFTNVSSSSTTIKLTSNNAAETQKMTLIIKH